MNLLEVQQAGPGCKIDGGLMVYVQAHKTIVNNAHTVVQVRDDSGVTMDAIIFSTTAVQVGAWYQATQKIGPKGPQVKYQQRGDNPPGLAIDGSVFQLFPGRQGPPAAGAAMPAAAGPGFGLAPAGAPAAGRLTDEVLLRAVQRWVKYLDGAVPNLSPENMSTILGTLLIGVEKGTVALAPAQGSQPAPPPAQAAPAEPSRPEEYWGNPPADDDPPF